MTTMSRAQATGMLLGLGFDTARTDFATAVDGFQRGWNLGPALAVDGDLGPLTSAALAVSYARLRQGRPTMSAHFSYVEFRCKCGGAFADCRRIWVLRAHVRRLEAHREHVARAVRIVSGCRCPGRNEAVGGKKASQHLFGGASDIEGLLTLSQRRALGLFAGIGYQASTKRVVHVDSRDVSGHPTTGGTPASPTVWKYA